MLEVLHIYRLPLLSKELVILAISTLVFAIACKKTDTLYCDEQTPCTTSERPFCDIGGVYAASGGIGRTCIARPNTIVDGGISQPDADLIDARIFCMDSIDCGGITPICTAGTCEACTLGTLGDAACTDRNSAQGVCAPSGRCQECTREAHCENPAEPICDDTLGICKPCTGHGECLSGICALEEGTCIAASAVVYVDYQNGADGSNCGNGPGSAACKHLNSRGGSSGALDKLDSFRQTIVLPGGEHPEGVSISSKKVEIFGNGTRFVLPGVINSPVMRVRALSRVILHNVSVEGGRGMGSGHGVACENSTIKMYGVTVRENESAGLSASECTLTISSSEISGNGRRGLDLKGVGLEIQKSKISDNRSLGLFAYDSHLEVKQCEILRNNAGGMDLATTSFLIENTVIAGNGNDFINPTNYAGGILVENHPSIAPQIIRHCTIMNNQSVDFLNAAGIDCGSGSSTVQCDSLIVFNNTLSENEALQISSSCHVQYSNIGDEFIGQGNISVAPSFVDESTYNYHLGPGSGGIDVANPNSLSVVDLDNQSRPNGNGYDMGADEVH